uniref:NADH-ubiquinone oxidoreductase chain 3 n=1 Tax=Drabescoides nuchalis TaxID=1725375 RepID=A0A0U2JSQ9_9HEMI|nr:NADH dehydrogenase subunit 3 [Drabescoides nuchalis]ALF99736.1 NADH dehydrogenase subunit 3 [Drabescoides nuchalis]
MNMLIVMMTLILIIMSMLMIVIMMVSKKPLTDNQKATPFECGFNPMSYSRLPFSIHFFMIAVIFLIFDIEIIMIMPTILTMKISMLKMWISTSVMFTIILIMGLYHEWINGMINWTN